MREAMTVEFEIKILKALALFTGGDIGQYNLSSIYCEIMPKETRLVATDGVRMALYRGKPGDKNGTGTMSVLLSVDAIKAIDGCGPANIAVDGKGQADIRYLSRSGHQATLHAVQGGGRFPNYRAALPQQCNLEIAVYDPQNLQLFVKASKILCPSEESNYFGDHCIIYPNGCDRAGIIEILCDRKFTGVIMPMPQVSKECDPNMFWIEEAADAE